MSELKAFDIVVSKEGYGEGFVTYRQAVYDKSEADKVIAELKQKINEAHQKVLDEKRHSDYKRCLAMAKWCASERDIYNLTPRFAKMEFYTKWRKRWLKIAEQFKETK